DRYCELRNSLSVCCKLCGRDIKLSIKSRYDLGHWTAHRKRCLKKSSSASSSSSSAGLKDGKTDVRHPEARDSKANNNNVVKGTKISARNVATNHAHNISGKTNTCNIAAEGKADAHQCSDADARNAVKDTKANGCNSFREPFPLDPDAISLKRFKPKQ